MNRFLTFVLLFLFPMMVSAQTDTTIRVLGLITSTANTQDATKEMLEIQEAWNDSGIPAGPQGSTSVSLIWLGLPFPLSDVTGTGDLQTQFNAARNSVALAELRDYYGADVVIVFTGNFGTSSGGIARCGGASAGNWAGDPPSGFQQDANGLDLRNKDTAFLAVVGTTGPCKSYSNFYSAAHEFGHILGAGHYNPRVDASGAPDGTWLYPDSRAYVYVWWEQAVYQLKSQKTLMASGAPSRCVTETPSSPGCNYWTNRYSQKPPPSNIGSDDRENERALQTTARSVANYRVGNGTLGGPTECNDAIDNDGDGTVDVNDADCVDAFDNLEGFDPSGPGTPCGTPPAPNYITGSFLGCLVLADGDLWAHHFVSWEDTNCTSHYEVYLAQPAGGTPIFKGFSFTPFGRAFVKGIPARLRLKSCNSGIANGCSSLSSASRLLDPC